MWESMGYWLAQQEVARGGQPWYFFLVMAVNYELLPFLLAIPALVYYGMKRDKLGVMLGLLSLCTFGVYTWTSEKMPWLTVEVVLPFIVLAGKFIGDITGGLVSGILPRFHAAWMLLRVAGMADARRRGSWALVADSLSLLPLVAIPAAIALGVWLLSRYVHSGELDTTSLMLMVSVALLILLTLTVMLFDRWQGSVKLGALGMSVLLVGFYAFVGLRASYTYDDTPVEMLVYAQGSYQMREVAREVQKEMEKHADDEVAVDYELWYPYAWYARDDKYVHYYCYKEQNEDGWVSWCKPIKEVPKAAIVLLNTQHGRRDAAQLVANYERRGEYRNLLWFPQVYRIPEIQTDDGFLKRRGKELQYVWDNVQRRQAWDGFLDYVIYRRLNSPWWFSDFYAYFPKAG
jgi:predicted membrane-bound mannosyltransferase